MAEKPKTFLILAFLFLVSKEISAQISQDSLRLDDGYDKLTNSVLYYFAVNSTEEERQATIKKYVKELTSPLRPSIIQQPPILLLDNHSFLRFSPHFEQFSNLARDYDMDKEMANSKDEFFATIYEIEAAMDAEELNSLTDQVATLNRTRLELSLHNVFTVPRHYSSSETFRHGAGDYISRKFGKLGLIVGLQQFAPTQFHDMFFKGVVDSLPVGSNVFSIYPGKFWGTPQDRVVIVGAHWDTVQWSDGFNDNGSGVVALLEMARVIVRNKCHLENSVIFVAFDLEEVGSQGSYEFIQRFLIPQILRKYGQNDIAGAFILDTVLNFNSSAHSQEINEDMESLVDLAEAIAKNDHRGDFINMWKRSFYDDALADTFRRHWNKEPSQFRLLDATLEFESQVPSAQMMEEKISYFRSDHSRFWIVNQPDFASFKAVLLTDTGPFRGLMRKCYHHPCDSVRNGNRAEFANFDFYQKVIQTTLDSVLDLSRAQCAKIVLEDESESAPRKKKEIDDDKAHSQINHASFFTVIIVAILNYFIAARKY